MINTLCHTIVQNPKGYVRETFLTLESSASKAIVKVNCRSAAMQYMAISLTCIIVVKYC